LSKLIGTRERNGRSIEGRWGNDTFFWKSWKIRGGDRNEGKGKEGIFAGNDQTVSKVAVLSMKTAVGSLRRLPTEIASYTLTEMLDRWV
jgi:hypothetical protein